jgi:glyoxylase-like metal-dependent hydrolase (beta-lactamase superfamily II)
MHERSLPKGPCSYLTKPFARYVFATKRKRINRDDRLVLQAVEQLGESNDRRNLMTITAQLTWDVFVSPGELSVIDDLAPGVQYGMWSPISSTLVTGQRDAVLVDALMTTTQARVLAGWVAATGKNLTTVYVTHGHGDHHFGLSVILDRFPTARAVATPAVVEHMRESVDPQAVASFWAGLMPGQIPGRLVVAEPLKDGRFDLEGHELVAVDLGHTDTDDTTCLHVPDIGLVIAGDAVYNDVHLYLAESDPDRRKAWIAAIATIEGLDPRAVISGHKRVGRADDPQTLEETRQYIRDFDRIDADTTSARELYDQMLALYPDRVNPGVLWISARALKQ